MSELSTAKREYLEIVGEIDEASQIKHIEKDYMDCLIKREELFFNRLNSLLISSRKPQGYPMSRDSKRKNFSIHPDDKAEINGIFAELKKRTMNYSGVICKLLKQFRDNGYRFNDEAN